MQVSRTNAEGLKREYRISVPAAEISEKVAGRLAELRRTVAVPGFRPGKAPLTLLDKRFGAAVRGEVLEAAVQAATESALADEGVRPALQPEIDIVKFEDGEDLEYTVALEMMPEIAPIDFSALELERLVAEPSESAVAGSIERLAESRTEYAPADDGRAAAGSDRVKIDFVGSIDGEPFEGGAAEDFELRVGAAELAPGFDEGLVGMAAGEEKTIEVAFPDDYPAEHLKGRAASFAVTMKEVRAPLPVVVDDAFARSVGLEDLAALNSMIRAGIARDYADMSRERLKRALLDKLADAHSFDLPPGMVAREFDAIWPRVKEAAEQGRLDEDDKALSEDALEARYRRIAERRVRLGLLLAEIGRANNIEVTPEDLERGITTRALRFPGQERRVVELFRDNPGAVREIQGPILEDKVVDFIIEMAQVTDRPVDVEELAAAPGAEDG